VRRARRRAAALEIGDIHCFGKRKKGTFTISGYAWPEMVNVPFFLFPKQ